VTNVSLYSDQEILVDDIVDAMRQNKSVLVRAATGFGKTRVGAHMMDRARLKSRRVGFVVPRVELLKQTAKSLAALGIPFTYFAAGYPYNPFEQVFLMMGPTVSLRIDKAPRLDVVFIDEAHYGGADLNRVIRHYQAMGAWVIGLSATPYKNNGQGMGEWYDVLVNGPSVKWLMGNGRLSKYRMFAPDKPPVEKLRVRDGGYVEKDVDAMMGSDEVGKVIIGNAARHYLSHAPNTLATTFCTSIKTAKMAAQQFNDAGIPSAAVWGDMDASDLDRIIKAFARREIKNLTCASLLEFGWDLSQASGMDVTVESLFDTNPSKSENRVIQRWGRALRMKPDPALMFDHAGNCDVHGLPDDDRDYTLEGREKDKRRQGERTIPVRQCGACYMVHRPSPTCPGCGHVYPIKSRMVDEVDGELSEVLERRAKVEKKMQQGRAKTLPELMALGYSRGRALHVLRARKGSK
jgi:superfamily II DNA or RNA helicase